MKINLIAPVEECSGYGEFSRHILDGLKSVGADIRIQPIRLDGFRDIKSAFTPDGGPHKAPDINLVCLVPTTFGQYRNPRARKNIGFSMFEAESIPETWGAACKQMDAVLVPTRHSHYIFRKIEQDGPKRVYLARPPIDFDWAAGRVRPVRPNPTEKTPFVFYSIFQWTERKNPIGLIRAYWAAFSGQTDVVLALKLYLKNQDPAEKARITAEIAKLKSQVRLNHYPAIEIEWRHLSKSQMIDFHLAGDVFVSATRGEGLGLGHIEAMALGTPIISTRSTGMADFLSKDNGHPAYDLEKGFQAPNCWLVPHNTAPTYGMGEYSSFYTGQMLWSEPDLGGLIDRFRIARVAHQDGLLKGVQAAKDVRELYDQAKCSQGLLNTFKTILGEG